jgi:hypothetical protein
MMLAPILACIASAIVCGLLARSIWQALKRGWILEGELRLIDRSEMPQAIVERLAWRAAIAFIVFLILLYCTMAALVADGFYRLEL